MHPIPAQWRRPLLLRHIFFAALALSLLGAAAHRAGAQEFAAADWDFFEKKIRPVLVEQCGECHGAQADSVQGGLVVDYRETLLAGGDTGPAIVPGKPDESLLIQALRYDGDLYQMPPEGKLPDHVIADFERWVELGAPAPAAKAPAAKPTEVDFDAAREHWAFQPIADPPAPRLDEPWAASPIDAFILERLQRANLRPAPPADPATLLRRAYFDLIGLPPTPEQLEAFLADDSPDAFAKVVDELLASPQYGERWGRRWLDLARYADTNGVDENYVYPNAWRYRDYVIRAFNQDKPYDQFVLEQVAGDLLPPARDPQQAADQLTATGFLVLGPKMLAEQDKDKLLVDVVDEQIDTVGQTFLGLTLGCARCHDHKFDPIPTRDYYALAGIFLSTRTMKHLEHVSEWLERPIPGHPLAKRYLELEAEIVAKTKERDSVFSNVAQPTEEMKARRKELEEEVKKLEAELATYPTVMAVAEGEPKDVPVHIRGSHLNLAPQPTPRGTLQVLNHLAPSPAMPSSGSGRLELARWIVDRRNPLTARVIVNRLWKGHFGHGLVRTPSDFGFRGEPPTHPELLDWLASRLVEGGWSIKTLHRRIMLSNAYRMSSAYGSAAEIDPENRLLWRQNRTRLEVEPIRDALLAITGDLDLTIGGRLEDTPADSKYARTTDAPFQLPRRTLYLPVVRNRIYEMFAIFDYVDAGMHLPKRSTTTVPHQALFMMNNPLVVAQAEKLARRLLELPSDNARLEYVYQLLFSRSIRPAERTMAKEYLAALDESLLHEAAALAGESGEAETAESDSASQPPSAAIPQPNDAKPGSRSAELAAWASLCRVLLAANEFIYVN